MKTKEFTRMHVSYPVSNIEKTIEFYNKFFEQEPAKTKKGYAKYLLDEPFLNISFHESSKLNKDYIHFGIEISNAEQMKQRLGNAMKHNLSIDEEKDVKCCYAKQDKFWVTDPDGYKWEVFQFLEDVEQNDSQYATEEACCA